MRLLFLHGAGGYDDDRPLADGLGRALGVPVDLPRLPDEDMSLEAWAAPVRAGLTQLGADDLLVGHSFGATVLLHVLAERSWAVRRALLLAMPDWGPDGWDVAEYRFTGAEPGTALSLHHCRDDDVVPCAHLALHAARLPGAQVHEHPAGGHQLDGLAEVIATDALGRRPSR